MQDGITTDEAKAGATITSWGIGHRMGSERLTKCRPALFVAPASN